MPVEISKIFRFESAHYLPGFPEGHKCRRLHGHSFRVEVAVAGEIDPETGVVMDYGVITAAVKPYIDLLDHRLINEVGAEQADALLLNPTSEHLALWFWRRLHPTLPGLSAVTVYETCTTRCTYRG